MKTLIYFTCTLFFLVLCSLTIFAQQPPSATLVVCIKPDGKLELPDKKGSCKKDETRGTLLRGNGKAADSDKLDGLNSTDFSLATHNHDDRYYMKNETLSTFDAIDLFQLKCPSGLTRSGDVCFSELRTAGTWDDALLGCANSHLRLPTIGEQSQIVLGTAQIGYTEEDWVGDNTDATHAMAFKQINFGIGVFEHLKSDPLTYRCVGSPNNLIPGTSSPTRNAIPLQSLSKGP